MPQFPYLQNKNNYTYLPHRNLIQHCLASAHLFKLWTKLHSNSEHLHKLKLRVKNNLAEAAREGPTTTGAEHLFVWRLLLQVLFSNLRAKLAASSCTTDSPPTQDTALVKSQHCPASARSAGLALPAAHSSRALGARATASRQGGQPERSVKLVLQACPHPGRPFLGASESARTRCSRRSLATPNRCGGQSSLGPCLATVRGRGSRHYSVRPQCGSGPGGPARRLALSPATIEAPARILPPTSPPGTASGGKMAAPAASPARGGWRNRGVVSPSAGCAVPPSHPETAGGRGERETGSGRSGHRRRRRGPQEAPHTHLSPAAAAALGPGLDGQQTGGHGGCVCAGAGASRSCRACR